MMRAPLMLLVLVSPDAMLKPAEQMTVGEFWKTSLVSFVEPALPKGHPRIVRVDQPRPAFPLGLPPNTTYVTAYSVALPIGADFCARARYVVKTTPIPTDPEARITAMPQIASKADAIWEYRYAPRHRGCAGRATYFEINGATRNEVFSYVRSLAGYSAVARKKLPGHLATSATCRDSLLPGPCNPVFEFAQLNLGGIQAVRGPKADDRDFTTSLGRLAMRQRGTMIEIDTSIGCFTREMTQILFREGRVVRLYYDRSQLIC